MLIFLEEKQTDRVILHVTLYASCLMSGSGPLIDLVSVLQWRLKKQSQFYKQHIRLRQTHKVALVSTQFANPENKRFLVLQLL